MVERREAGKCEQSPFDCSGKVCTSLGFKPLLDPLWGHFVFSKTNHDCKLELHPENHQYTCERCHAAALRSPERGQSCCHPQHSKYQHRLEHIGSLHCKHECWMSFGKIWKTSYCWLENWWPKGKGAKSKTTKRAQERPLPYSEGGLFQFLCCYPPVPSTEFQSLSN